MRILCVSDHVDPLVYSAAVKTRFGDVDLVLSAGDLPMEYLGFIASSLNKHIYFVFGNHNLKYLAQFRRWSVERPEEYKIGNEQLTQHSFGSIYIGSRVVNHRGLLIAGLGGCRRYNTGENQFTEYQMFRRIVSLLPRLLWNRIRHGRYLDILLTHAPPFGINDRPDLTHAGFKVFKWFVTRFRPKYLLHGHIHLYDLNSERVAEFEDTRIINVYDHYILEIDPERGSA